MSFEISEMKSGGAEAIPKGSYPIRVYAIVSYGIQPMTDWKTGAPKPSEKRVALTYEFPTEAFDKEQEDGTVVHLPRRLTKECKVSNHAKSGLMEAIGAIKPDATKLTDLLNEAGSATVGRTSGDKAKISSLAPIMKGMEVGELMDGTLAFDFYEPDEASFKRLVKWQQDMIVGAEDYNGFADTWVQGDTSDY